MLKENETTPAKKKPATIFVACGENIYVARPQSRVALRATSLAAAVAHNSYSDPNVAPAQQRNRKLMPCLCGARIISFSCIETIFVAYYTK